MAEVWRLGPDSTMLSSIPEEVAVHFADMAPHSIFFYATLDNAKELVNTESTIDKVYSALVEVGLSETQIISAINRMQNAGIYFREAADL